MGNTLVAYWKNRITAAQKTAFLSAMITGLLVHAYKFLNTLPNHDAILNEYASQDLTASGRWFLSIACGFSSYFDLQWLNGLLAVFFIALTMAVIADLFQMENPIVILLSAGLLSSFPAVTETFFFGYTADGYMLAMLLSAVSVHALRFGRNRPRDFLLSGVCLCLSCGIYQAYVSFAILLAIS